MLEVRRRRLELRFEPLIVPPLPVERAGQQHYDHQLRAPQQ
jgi:hypothetical protein